MRSVVVLALGAAACGELVSLDAPSVDASDAADTVDVTTAPSTSSATESSTASPDPTSTDATGVAPDLPVDPPTTCDPGCEVELVSRWRWRAPSLQVPNTKGSRSLTGLARLFNDGLLVAEQRGDRIWISNLASDGQEQWTSLLELFCDCTLVDLAQSPLGDVVFTAEGSSGGFTPLMVVGRFGGGDLGSAWFEWVFLSGTPERQPRVGSVVPRVANFGGRGATGAMLIEPDLSTPDREIVRMFVFDVFVSIIDLTNIDFQWATDPRHRPLGIELGSADLAVAFPAFDGDQDRGYVVWLQPGSYQARDAQPLPGISDDLAVGADGRLIVVSHLQRTPEQLELHVASLAPDLPPSWEASHGVWTEWAGPARLAVDAQGRTYLAVPRLQGDGDELELGIELLSFEDDGRLRFRTAVPMVAEPGSHPVELAVTGEGSIVLAATVNGRVQVEAFEQGCTCEE
ncbi:MAG: hypothetical protein AB1Z98_39190 [Nannocystaceae bacterium]